MGFWWRRMPRLVNGEDRRGGSEIESISSTSSYASRVEIERTEKKTAQSRKPSNLESDTLISESTVSYTQCPVSRPCSVQAVKESASNRSEWENKGRLTILESLRLRESMTREGRLIRSLQSSVISCLRTGRENGRVDFSPICQFWTK